MVEFRYDIRGLFPQPIVKVSSSLLPHTFRGDRRQALDATSKMSEIIDRLGQLSAVSQKLTKPVTTAQRLRMSENQIIYLLADVNAGKHGTVLGLLKVGTKDLYLFDEAGKTRKIENAPCILDFYIHESRQRAGLGKDLFETMLVEENWTPIKCSVDRPSEKLLGFLKKHYGLVKTVPQANNFVLYEGFFDDGDGNASHSQHTNGGMHITNSPNTQLFGAHYLGDDDHNKKRTRHNDTSNVGVPITQISPVGRYGARRPTCSMAEKTASDVSLTPSQAAAVEQAKARKNPLDALSRTSMRHETVEKRSGLQDVDDEYYKKNVFSRSSFPRHSGLNDVYGSKSQIQNHMAGGQKNTMSHPIGMEGDGVNLTSATTPSQAQLLAQQQQQVHAQAHAQAKAQMQAQAQPMQCKNQSIQNQSHASQSQAQMQQLQQHQHQHQQQQQMLSAAAQHHQQQQQQEQVLPTAAATPQQQQQLHQNQAAYMAAGGGGEPEMCTTCPNCQTTIYLVRGNDIVANDHPPMGQPQIIHSNSSTNKGGAVEASSTSPNQIVDDIDTITEDLQNLVTTIEPEELHETELEPEQQEFTDELQVTDMPVEEISTNRDDNGNSKTHSVSGTESITGVGGSHIPKQAAAFQLSKQHTGMKNRSFGVGMAVTPTNKMEFDQEAREEFGVVKINRPIGKITSPTESTKVDNTDAMSTVSSAGEGLTDQGYYDLKFYHNKLW